MEKFCINHPEEKAVGTCGGCGALTCYRCSMNVDQVVYCSLDCFNQLNPPSSPEILKVTAPPETPADSSSVQISGLGDDYSDILEANPVRPPAAPVPPAPVESAPVSLEDPSIVLSTAQADEASTMMFSKYRDPSTGEDSTLVIIPGTRRSVLSSSCFFHPDTSAIVLCAECRNPICSLCARETAGGLACSPSCGPADPAREDDRRKDQFWTGMLAAGVLLVFLGGFLILRSAGQVQTRGAASTIAQASVATEEPRDPRPAAPEPLAPAAPAEPAAPEPPASASAPESLSTVAPPVVFRPIVRPPWPASAPAVESAALDAPQTGTSEPVAPSPRPLRTIAAETPRPPEPPRLSPYERDIRWASSLLREATPLVREVSEEIGPEWRPGLDVHGLSTKLDRAVVKLRQAQELYVRRIGEAPDRSQVEDRISAIADSLKTAQEGFERMGGVPQWRR